MPDFDPAAARAMAESDEYGPYWLRARLFAALDVIDAQAKRIAELNRVYNAVHSYLLAQLRHEPLAAVWNELLKAHDATASSRALEES